MVDRARALFLLFLVLLLPVRAAASAPRAIWIWEEETLHILDDAKFREDAMQFLEQRGIRTIYLYADSFKKRNPVAHEQKKLAKTVAEFHERGFKVQALLGSIYLHTERYILPTRRVDAERMFKRILDYNAAVSPAERFDGANLDIEPYVLDDWRPRRRERARQYLDLCARFVRMRDDAEAKLELGPAIPFWFDGIPVEWRGETAPISEHVQRLFDYVSIMDYRDRAEGGDGIISHAEDEMAFAESIGRKVVVGVETLKTSPEKVTFHEEGNAALEKELAVTEKAFFGRPGFGGFAIHHYRTYRVLPEGPRK